MKVDLPDGAWAELLSRDEITERVFRVIDRAETKTMHVSAKLIENGYDVPSQRPKDLSKQELEVRDLKNLKLTTGLSDEDQDIFNDYQLALILGLTKDWSYAVELTTDAVLDLPKTVFESLAKFCQDEYKGTDVDTGPDPNSTARGADSGD
jgi:hypothetical protein